MNSTDQCMAHIHAFRPRYFLMCLARTLSMSRYGLFLSGGRIVVDIVASAVSQKNTALLLYLADQFAALHSAISLVL